MLTKGEMLSLEYLEKAPDSLLMTEALTALKVNKSASALAHDRVSGKPDTLPFLRLGPKTIRYRLGDVRAYLGERRNAPAGYPTKRNQKVPLPDAEVIDVPRPDIKVVNARRSDAENKLNNAGRSDAKSTETLNETTPA